MREGLEKGDTVALVMPSCPDYGMSRPSPHKRWRCLAFNPYNSALFIFDTYVPLLE